MEIQRTKMNKLDFCSVLKTCRVPRFKLHKVGIITINTWIHLLPFMIHSDCCCIGKHWIRIWFSTTHENECLEKCDYWSCMDKNNRIWATFACSVNVVSFNDGSEQPLSDVSCACLHKEWVIHIRLQKCFGGLHLNCKVWNLSTWSLAVKSPKTDYKWQNQNRLTAKGSVVELAIITARRQLDLHSCVQWVSPYTFTRAIGKHNSKWHCQRHPCPSAGQMITSFMEHYSLIITLTDLICRPVGSLGRRSKTVGHG